MATIKTHTAGPAAKISSEPAIALPAKLDLSPPAAPALLDGKEAPNVTLARTANARMAQRTQPLAIKGPSTFRVMGLTQPEAMQLSRGSIPEQLAGTTDVFSSKHDQGDIGNRWSHGAIIQTVTAAATASGLPLPIAALVGAAVLLPKEYMVDLHPSPSDMGLVGRFLSLPLANGGSVDAYGAFYGDKAAFGNLQVRF